METNITSVKAWEQRCLELIKQLDERNATIKLLEDHIESLSKELAEANIAIDILRK